MLKMAPVHPKRSELSFWNRTEERDRSRAWVSAKAITNTATSPFAEKHQLRRVFDRQSA